MRPYNLCSRQPHSRAHCLIIHSFTRSAAAASNPFVFTHCRVFSMAIICAFFFQFSFPPRPTECQLCTAHSNAMHLARTPRLSPPLKVIWWWYSVSVWRRRRHVCSWYIHFECSILYWCGKSQQRIRAATICTPRVIYALAVRFGVPAIFKWSSRKGLNARARATAPHRST